MEDMMSMLMGFADKVSRMTPEEYEAYEPEALAAAREVANDPDPYDDGEFRILEGVMDEV